MLSGSWMSSSVTCSSQPEASSTQLTRSVTADSLCALYFWYHRLATSSEESPDPKMSAAELQ